MMLTIWMQSLDELRNKHDWLLFFSLPKLLFLYHLLQADDPNLEAIVHEISFLCSNEQAALKSVRMGVEVSLSVEDVGDELFLKLFCYNVFRLILEIPTELH